MWSSIKITNRITVLKLSVSDNPVSFQNKKRIRKVSFLSVLKFSGLLHHQWCQYV